MTSSMHIDNENKDILILDEETIQGLDITPINSRSYISY